MRARAPQLLALLFAGFAALSLVFGNPVATLAGQSAARVAASAGAVYVSLRSINAALSVAQEVDVGGSMFVSAEVQPLKVLEPVDDTVEQVAATIFAVSVAAMALSVAFGPVAGIGAGLLVLAGGLWVLSRRATGGQGARGLARLAVAGGVLAFGLPVLFWSASGVAVLATGADLAQARLELRTIAEGADTVVDLGETLPEGAEAEAEIDIDTWTVIRNSFSRVNFFLANADTILDASLRIIGLLLLQTLVLPVLLTGLGLWVLREALR
ncbi:hypothetical protein [Litorisediminicola beolgyonensis]|uniref:Uncharacterized protein n=1 Tax=Litorisediminicola beolgyonensis TaxID=1173614 RepID=A0ABW3ZKF3_9RHOB